MTTENYSDLEKINEIDVSGDLIRKLLEEQNSKKKLILELLLALNSLDLPTKKRKHFKGLYRGLACREAITFTEESWVDQLLNHHKNFTFDLEDSIKKQKETIHRLEQSFRYRSGDKPSISEEPEKHKKDCEICSNSILPCFFHKNIYKDHTFDKELFEKLSPDVILAIDTEQVSVEVGKLSNGKTKYTNRCFRVSVIADIRKKPLILHSYWLPEGRIRSYQEVTGISTREIISNKQFFKKFEEGRKQLLEVIQNRIVVFANAQSDLRALELENDPKFRDIQSFFRVYNPITKHFEPKGLDYLIKNVLFKPGRKGKHDPTSDSRFTLRLYKTIPDTHWQSNTECLEG